MYLDELMSIVEKLRVVKIGDERAQNYLGAAVINLNHTIERVREATQQGGGEIHAMDMDDIRNSRYKKSR